MGAFLFQPSQFRFLPEVLLRMVYVESESKLEKELPLWVGLCRNQGCRAPRTLCRRPESFRFLISLWCPWAVAPWGQLIILHLWSTVEGACGDVGRLSTSPGGGTASPAHRETPPRRVDRMDVATGLSRGLLDQSPSYKNSG